MKTGFYSKLAFSSIRKNKSFYFPYILTCIGMIMMFYIISFLSYSEFVLQLRGGDIITVVLRLGSVVIAIFSLIFLFYTNTFLIRKRLKEFGLYNILGMGKSNIAKILTWESIIIFIISFVFGSAAGIAFSKLAELTLANIIDADINYSFVISGKAVLASFILFAAIFTVILINNLRRLYTSGVNLLINSEKTGEKPPKANYILGLAGLALLFAAYWMAVSIDEPLSALYWFFIAVLMVIIGTYLIFIAGSVLLCRLLQKNKKYYYKTNHFVFVSSMAFRMKRNGAGLASVCVLSTMVLVMPSSTASLYFGSEEAINNRYPNDVNIEVRFDSIYGLDSENINLVRNSVTDCMRNFSENESNTEDYTCISFFGGIDDKNITALLSGAYVNTNIFTVCLFSLDDYNSLMDERDSLNSDEIMIYTYRSEYKYDTLKFPDGKVFNVKKNLDSFITRGDAMFSIVPTMFIICDDVNAAAESILGLREAADETTVYFNWHYSFDSSLDDSSHIEFMNSITEVLNRMLDNKENAVNNYSCESLAENREAYFAQYGGLFFLGIILSLVFISAAVLIIYYKQLSEGYEDAARFEIMQNVGMTKRDIRKSINSQLLTVFFAPLIFAGIHLSFAFPIIRHLLLLFNLNNVMLFAVSTLISFLLFAVFYVMVYCVTSNAYFGIVSKKENYIS